VIYHEHRFWSVFLDCRAARLSVADERGGEFFTVVPLASGEKWRETRDRALGAIRDAMDAGMAPGEVTIHAGDGR
jgi:hypothetical protein